MKIKGQLFHFISSIFVTAVILIVAGSCVEELDGGIEDRPEQEYLAFSARLSGEATKAAPMTSLNGEAGIIGYIYDQWPSGDAMKTFAPWNMLDKKSFTFDGDQLATTEGMIKWSEVENEGGSSLKIYAYAPITDGNMSVSYGTEGNYSIPSIRYTVPEDISKQKDIITAIAEVGSGFRKNIPLTFDHILTGVQFKAGFECKVNSITVSGVASAGEYTMGEGWSGQSGNGTYTLSFDAPGKSVKTGDIITGDADSTVLFMIPQKFSDGSTASITMNYDNGQSISTSLKGITWEEGRMITYTLHKTDDDDSSSNKTIYFDLAAGPVTIEAGGNCTGYAFTYGGTGKVSISEAHTENNRYYVYQSSESNKATTGWSGAYGKSTFTLPEYDPVMYNDILWSDWIRNNTDVKNVIDIWATESNRSGTPYSISVTSNDVNSKIDLTIDNIYSTVQELSNVSTKAGIVFTPPQYEISASALTINLIGDNRVGNIYYKNMYNNDNRLIFDGKGSLTVASVDRSVASKNNTTGYYANWWRSAIGSNDSDGGPDNSYGIVFNSGTIYAGTTMAECCSAIGGGGNGEAKITINGGTITAVAATTGATIGGGMAVSAEGGGGDVVINGGNVYAYNFKNGYNIPSAAIGGGGSSAKIGNYGNVTITGGNIYAYSIGGTAIGGGSSSTTHGGTAKVTITGGNVIAISAKGDNMPAGAGIGGGTGGSNSGANGGSATVTISGNPIIRTGSIGGGKTNNSTGKIGSATINISGGDIQAQFVMAAGAVTKPSFTMTGGLIRNSDTTDEEYKHIQTNGGAVYLEDGKFTMSGGEIRQCRAEKGGAIYVKGTAGPEFNMTGGTITECAADTDGGAIYLEGGVVNMSGGTVSHNLANNGNGGGFCIVGGDFTMDDTGAAAGNEAKIFENAAFSQNITGGMGGGIYVTSAGSVDVSILSGSITENSSDRVGGGIAVDMTDNDTATASVTVGKNDGGKENPLISNNHTIIMGGGLYAKGTNANIAINSGKIKNNTISGYVSNPDVANEEGSVTLNGGDVTHVTVTYNNNAKFLGLQDSYVEEVTQDIVTATKSRMVVSKQFSMPQHTFSGWNTRPDGKGTAYTHGQIMNLSSDLTLYAQWTRN